MTSFPTIIPRIKNKELEKDHLSTKYEYDSISPRDYFDFLEQLGKNMGTSNEART